MPTGCPEEAEVQQIVALARLWRGRDVRSVPHWDPGSTPLAFGVVLGTEQVLREFDDPQGERAI
jgi:hypothetical protein